MHEQSYRAYDIRVNNVANWYENNAARVERWRESSNKQNILPDCCHTGSINTKSHGYTYRTRARIYRTCTSKLHTDIIVRTSFSGPQRCNNSYQTPFKFGSANFMTSAKRIFLKPLIVLHRFLLPLLSRNATVVAYWQLWCNAVTLHKQAITVSRYRYGGCF